MSNKGGCSVGCSGCLMTIIFGIALFWFFFMGGCILIEKKTQDAINEPTPIEKTGK